MTQDELYLEKAKGLADRIMPAFETPSGLPTSNVNLAQRKGVPAQDNRGLVSTAEASTLQLEFRYLSYLTDNDAYWDVAENVIHTYLETATGFRKLIYESGHASHQGRELNDWSRFDIHEVSVSQSMRLLTLTNVVLKPYRWPLCAVTYSLGFPRRLVLRIPPVSAAHTVE